MVPFGMRFLDLAVETSKLMTRMQGVDCTTWWN